MKIILKMADSHSPTVMNASRPILQKPSRKSASGIHLNPCICEKGGTPGWILLYRHRVM